MQNINQERVIVHEIRNVNAVQRQTTKCFGTNAKYCDCVPVSADFAQIEIKCHRVTKGHIYKACHLAECNNIRDRTGSFELNPSEIHCHFSKISSDMPYIRKLVNCMELGGDIPHLYC